MDIKWALLAPHLPQGALSAVFVAGSVAPAFAAAAPGAQQGEEAACARLLLHGGRRQPSL